MGRGRVPSHLKRSKLHTGNVMLEAWIHEVIGKQATRNKMTIKDTIAQILTAHAKKETKGGPK